MDTPRINSRPVTHTAISVLATTVLAVPLLAWTALAFATPAQAEAMSHRDARHDVVRFPLDAPSGAQSEPAPGNARTDITRVQVNHRFDRVTSRLTLRELPTRKWVATWQIRTEIPQLFELSLIRYGTLADLTLARGGNDVSCPGLGEKINDDQETIWVSVPRSCLDRPRFVRVGAGMGTVSGGYNFADDARRDRGVDGAHTTLGPKLRRN